MGNLRAERRCVRPDSICANRTLCQGNAVPRYVNICAGERNSAIRSQPQGRRKGKSLLVALHHRKLITPDAQRTGLFTELEPDAATVCYCTKNARPLVRRWFKRARIARSAFHQEHQCPKDHLNSKRNTSGAWRW